jgi:hypothetical protein
VTLQGGGLPAGGQVTAQLTAPGGGVTRQSVRVGENGRFRLELPLAAAGSYQLVVRGQGLEETRTLEVQAPTGPSAPSSRQAPQEAAPPSPNEAIPDETTPEQVSPNTPTPGQNLTEPPPAETPALEVAHIANGLAAQRAGERLWQLTFPEGSGPTTEPLLTQGRLQNQLYVGHGSSLLRLEPETGRVQERFILSGPVERIERVDARTVAVTVRHGENLLERFTLRDDQLQEPVRFGLEPRTFGLLRAEAQVPDPAARLERDPTNPWLHLALGLRQNDPERATFAEAVETATTFYDLAGLATVLERNGERALAADAWDAAMRDFAARDYDPRLLRSARLEAAYNFPLTPLQAALARDDDISAGFWAERLYLAAPRVPGAGEALSAYAALLRVVAPPDTAELWERRAEESTPADATTLDRVATALAQNGWALALALFVTFLALHLTLFAKYARARRSDRGREGRAPWLFAVRYTTLSEKLVLLLLLAAVLACAALASWYGASRTPPEVVKSGTLANRAAQVYLAQFQEGAEPSGPSAALIRGYAAQVADDRGEARTLLESAGNYPPALNNLGVLTDNPELVARALVLQPGLVAARYNTATGNSERTALLPFQARYQPGEPALATPAERDFRAATSGSWQTALARAFTSPQLSFRSAPPFGLNLLLWRAAQLLFLLIVLIHVVFLFVPRPRSAADAPRPWLYELLALLVPGSGLADEAWGIFLLIPWAVLCLGALAHLFNWSVNMGLSPIGLYLGLGALYLLNTVAVIVEFLSHRSRRRTLELRRNDAQRA